MNKEENSHDYEMYLAMQLESSATRDKELNIIEDESYES
jgi:hypothetical protein